MAALSHGVLVQSRRDSVFETVANTAVGFALNLVLQVVFLGWFGVRIHPAQNVALTALFTAVSLLRGYLLRRLFAWRTEGL